MSGDTVADALADLLAPYADPHPDQAYRLVDVPPTVAVEALGLLPEDLVTARLNLTQPPMSWLVEQAADADLAGRLVGNVVPSRAFVRFDGIQVAAAKARMLAERVAVDWPPVGDVGSALAAAIAEVWTSRTAEWPLWSGTGADLLTQPLPAGAAVVGLIWD